MPLEALDDSDAFISEACWHYYVNEMTQAQVASLLGVTRLRVNQAIQKAKSLGMVKVQIESPFLARIELQERLREELGVPKVLVAPARREAYDYHVPAGAALADYLAECLRTRPWRTIGVSWGMTLQSAIERLPRLPCPDLEIVSMIGGTTEGASFNAFGIASGFAQRFSARYSLLAAPIFLSEGVSRDLFLAQQNFAEHMRKCEALDAAVLVVGDISPRSFLISAGLPPEVRPGGPDRRGRSRRPARALPRPERGRRLPAARAPDDWRGLGGARGDPGKDPCRRRSPQSRDHPCRREARIDRHAGNR